jgi:ATP-dependent Clp protease protease subunit
VLALFIKYPCIEMNSFFGKKSEANEGPESEKSEEKETNIYRENNHVYFYSEVNRRTVSLLQICLREAEEYCVLQSLRLRVPVPIYLHIYSDGGYIHAALSVMDLITALKADVYSVIDGATASAGTLISIVCKKRYIRPSAYMLIHQLSSSIWGKMGEIMDEFQNISDLHDKIIEIYAKYSKLTVKKLKKLLKHDLWLNADFSMKYGLVDEIYS